MMVHSSKRDGGNDLSYSNSFSLEPHETAKVLIQHPGWNQIHGSVVDFEGNPLEGISIGYGGNDGKEPNEFQINSSAKSSADGSFSIRAINGRYGISASTEHSLAISTHGKIQAGQVADPIRIQFPETRFVELKILNADGSAMESAKVEFAWHDVPRNSAPNSHTYDHRRLGETDLDGKK